MWLAEPNDYTGGTLNLVSSGPLGQKLDYQENALAEPKIWFRQIRQAKKTEHTRFLTRVTISKFSENSWNINLNLYLIRKCQKWIYKHPYR